MTACGILDRHREHEQVTESSNVRVEALGYRPSITLPEVTDAARNDPKKKKKRSFRGKVDYPALYYKIISENGKK